LLTFDYSPFPWSGIAMVSLRQAPKKKRRSPRQARASETVALILEAAAHILEAGGLEAFTTNAVAERAGVSIGSLYQYFANKQAILLALAQQEIQSTLATLRRHEAAQSPEDRVRHTVRAILNAFRGRLRVRKAVVEAILASGTGIEMMAPVAAFIAHHPRTLIPALTDEQVFVLSRALLGTIRSAMLDEQPFFRSRAFEDELVRLGASYLNAIVASGRGNVDRVSLILRSDT
jgi:AcrR family transcriptional regulator